MQTYRVTLKLRSASGSEWQADTIFGHLCWLMVWHKDFGEAKLQEWLARFQSGDPPLVLSDGFPGQLLPRPVPIFDRSRSEKSKNQGLREAEQRKPLKKINWLIEKEFETVRSGQVFKPDPEGDKVRDTLQGQRVNFKNQISRLSNTTGEEGQLYPFVEHLWKTITIYLQVADEEVETVRQLFEMMKDVGYGKRKTIGYGEIESLDWHSFDGFKPVEGANAFVSLSHFVPARNDPTEGQWKTKVKYGKLGGEWAATANPFKKPIIMLEPGSWFYTNTPKEWYGRLVSGISPAHPKVVQYGLAFAVPMRVSNDD